MTVRRLKTYAGTQGYVYQYYFVGSRPALAEYSVPPATEYVFDVTADRKTTFAVSVLVYAEALSTWAKSHGRQLTAAEQYAAAKLRLFHAFDELENMMSDGRFLHLDAPLLDNLLAGAGVT
jgi:hypothetical protein